MKRTFAVALRRANRMLHPAALNKALLSPARMTVATRSIQLAMTDLMVSTAMAPLTALTPKKSRTPAKPKTRKAVRPKVRKTPKPKATRMLSTALTRLRAGQTLLPGILGGQSALPADTPVIPDGARYLARTHRSAAGSRGYKLYLPASRPKQPEGLIVMLHGCNQTPDDFALGTHMNALAEKHGLIIAYPAQTGRRNAAACWNWFRPIDQRRGMGEPAILSSMARKLTREFGLDRDRVFVAGLSAGGAMAVILADVYPDVFAAAGVHSGLARGAAHDLRSAMSAMRRGGEAGGIAAAAPRGQGRRARMIVFQGDADSTVHPSNAPMIVAAAMGADALPTRTGNRTFGGRGYARRDYEGSDGSVRVEYWMIEGAGHAWSGGRSAGSYTDRKGPDASAQMVRFFLAGHGPA